MPPRNHVVRILAIAVTHSKTVSSLASLTRAARSSSLVKFSFAILLSSLLTPLAATAPDAKSSANARYKLVAGKGYSVCEAYLKHLNALPPEEPPPTCEIKLSPQYKNFRLPDWETLDWKKHLDWVFQLEQHLYVPTPHDDALKRLSFTEWKKNYLARVESGRLKPGLRRAKVALNEHGPEIVLDYDRRLGGCGESPRSAYGADGGSHYFVVVGGVPAQFELIAGWRQTSHMVLFGDRAYFMLFGGTPGLWEADVYTVFPRMPEPYPGAPRYIMQEKTCRYLPGKN